MPLTSTVLNSGAARPSSALSSSSCAVKQKRTINLKIYIAWGIRLSAQVRSITLSNIVLNRNVFNDFGIVHWMALCSTSLVQQSNAARATPRLHSVLRWTASSSWLNEWIWMIGQQIVEMCHYTSLQMWLTAMNQYNTFHQFNQLENRRDLIV